MKIFNLYYSTDATGDVHLGSFSCFKKIDIIAVVESIFNLDILSNKDVYQWETNHMIDLTYRLPEGNRFWIKVEEDELDLQWWL